MQRSIEQFEISPESFFAELDRGFAGLRASTATIERRLDAMAALCDELAITRLAAEAAAPLPRRWTYDARLPNYMFEDVFEPEPVPLGAKRWVGNSGRIAATLRLHRSLQYDLAVDIEDFVGEAAAQSFYLRIDGVQYPWLDHAEKRYASMILADGDAATVSFEIGIDRESIPADRDVSFSFRLIDISARA